MNLRRKVFFDTQLLGLQEEHLKAQLDLMKRGEHWRIDGPASPRWVNCKQCGAYRGDLCNRGRGYCPERVVANAKRMKELDTWGFRYVTLCHPNHPVQPHLVWRQVEENDKLTWNDVPCFTPGCGATFTVERYASELLERRMPVDRINPHMLEMTCWATEEDDPWTK